MTQEKRNWLGPYLGNGNLVHQVVQQAKLVYQLMLDPRVPLLAKLIPVAGLAYLISPIDLIADIIPVLGQADDVAVVLFSFRLFMEFAPPDVVHEHLKRLAGTVTPPAADDWRVVDDPGAPPPASGSVVEGTTVDKQDQ
jgi:uncharacterized membrane protein YkvA (DUF1232 family)